MLHKNPTKFIQVVENALDAIYREDEDRWSKVYDFYEARYLNPDSPYKEAFKNAYQVKGKVRAAILTALNEQTSLSDSPVKPLFWKLRDDQFVAYGIRFYVLSEKTLRIYFEFGQSATHNIKSFEEGVKLANEDHRKLIGEFLHEHA
jgi:hypothetical protein